MPVQLFIDKFRYIENSKNLEPIQATTKMDAIRKNCTIVNPTLLESITETLQNGEPLTAVFAAGKFICVLNIDIDSKLFVMMFINVGTNDDSFYTFLNNLSKEDPRFREMLIKAFHQLKENYDVIKDWYELAVYG